MRAVLEEMFELICGFEEMLNVFMVKIRVTKDRVWMKYRELC